MFLLYIFHTFWFKWKFSLFWQKKSYYHGPHMLLLCYPVVCKIFLVSSWIHIINILSWFMFECYICFSITSLHLTVKFPFLRFLIFLSVSFYTCGLIHMNFFLSSFALVSASQNNGIIWRWIIFGGGGWGGQKRNLFTRKIWLVTLPSRC